MARTAPPRKIAQRHSPEDLQHAFYTQTAELYDTMHVQARDEHYLALDHISTLITGLGLVSVLDVGTGTGRGMKHFLERNALLEEVRGIEPVRAMIDQAEQRNGIPAGQIVQGNGDSLPFADGSFDAVCELGVLHHVAKPNDIVVEMTRVARRAVFLSDANRFAGGRPLHRAAKFALHELGLWPTVYRLATHGRGYHLTEGDGGVVYSYSVYDSLELLSDWADTVYLLPTTKVGESRFHPRFTATNILVCALRDG
jgi:ubiquinone/menaquinone biosynthesis C-methylase UbiE